MLGIRPTNRFKKDVKKLSKQGKRLAKLGSVIDDLAAQKPLAPGLRDHLLVGDHAGCRECHVEPDWLLIYQVADGNLLLLRSGSHSELFGK